MSRRRISIIIPAHDEGAIIAHCLEQLIHASEVLDPEIIVVCNGCNDNTADIVRSFGDAIRCIETTVASKSNALNLGDNAASYFPRFYLDADIQFSLGNISNVVRAMDRSNVLAAAPKMQMDLTGSSWVVRSYYDVWCNLPYCREGLIGAGVYALSEEGRKRFSDFPDIIADDRFIRALFKENQRLGVSDTVSVVSAPVSLRGLIKIKTRSRLGGYEFESRFPDLLNNEIKAYDKAIIELIGKVSMWPKAFVYLGVNLFTRIRARQQSKAIGFSHWERDDSSRGKIRR